jgi:prevent-host-death family protein
MNSGMSPPLSAPVAPLSISGHVAGSDATTKDSFPNCTAFETMSGIGANMTAISATDAKLKLATLLNQAQRGPVMIRRNHRDVAVMLSATEYRRLHDGPVAAQRTVIDPKLAALLDASD